MEIHTYTTVLYHHLVGKTYTATYTSGEVEDGVYVAVYSGVYVAVYSDVHCV